VLCCLLIDVIGSCFADLFGHCFAPQELLKLCACEICISKCFFVASSKLACCSYSINE
jgi:hypothetical protein